ncbi:DUF159 family protein [Oscillospiraceae bacterium]|nr:DUF159 family protein [Oscillospiraceae bacterium]BDF75005.1 DUF159 family protein [Oscillospiraceae bacterium]
MCGRYQLDPGESAEIEAIVRQVQDRVKTGEVFPTNAVAVLSELAGELAPRPMVWGYPRFRGKSGSIINARSETAGERPMFRRSLAERRCVIPTTGFFEWGPGEGGGKRKYRFNRPGTRALYLAGLWNEFAGEEKCVILTTAANASVAAVHDRMPVILAWDEARAWVRDAGAAREILGRTPPALERAEA